MPVAAAIGGAAVSGLIGSNASSQASHAQTRSQQAAIDEQRRQYDLSRADLAPWRAAGANALGTLSNSFGSKFHTDPGYQFARKEGQRDIGNSFAARGGAFSGNALRGIAQFNSGLANQQYGDWWNRGAGLAGIGQQATNTGVIAGQNSANNISGLMQNQGDARASGIANQGNIWGNAIGGAANQIGQYYANRPASYDEYQRAGNQGSYWNT